MPYKRHHSQATRCSPIQYHRLSCLAICERRATGPNNRPFPYRLSLKTIQARNGHHSNMAPPLVPSTCGFFSFSCLRPRFFGSRRRNPGSQRVFPAWDARRAQVFPSGSAFSASTTPLRGYPTDDRRRDHQPGNVVEETKKGAETKKAAELFFGTIACWRSLTYRKIVLTPFSDQK